jgi:hypothetical protein
MEPQRKVLARHLRVSKVRPWYLRAPMLLIPLAAIAGAVYLRKSAQEHPLRDTERTELCSIIPPPPASLASRREAPQAGVARAATCEYFGLDDKLLLRVTFRSTRQLAVERGTRPADVVARRLKEVRGLYGNGGPVEGEWRNGGSWRVGFRQSLLFEDEGVMVLLESERLDAKALAAHANAVAKALRKPPDGVH